MKQRLLLTLTLCVLSFATAHSDMFIDTGSPTNSSASTLDSGQWLSQSFSVSTNYYLTEVDAFLKRPDVAGETQLTFALYADNAGGQIPGSELYTIKHDSVHTGDPRYANHSWQTLPAMNWYLPAGTYWVSFEVRSAEGDDYAGSMVGGTPSPLVGQGAYRNGPSSSWVAYDSVDFGIRMTGDVVPEPAVALLFGTGLLTVFVLRRNQKAAADRDD